jgi:hypothetical protein
MTDSNKLDGTIGPGSACIILSFCEQANALIGKLRPLAVQL